MSNDGANAPPRRAVAGISSTIATHLGEKVGPQLGPHDAHLAEVRISQRSGVSVFINHLLKGICSMFFSLNQLKCLLSTIDTHLGEKVGPQLGRDLVLGPHDAHLAKVRINEH